VSSLLTPSLYRNRRTINNMHRQSSLPRTSFRSVLTHIDQSFRQFDTQKDCQSLSSSEANLEEHEYIHMRRHDISRFHYIKSCNDVHNRDRRSSWGLASDHSVPPLSSESGVSEGPMQYHPTKLSRNATCSAYSPRASSADRMIFIAHQTDSHSQLMHIARTKE
jgi:hypothetical protein